MLSAAAGLMALWACQGSPGRMEPVTTREIESHIRYLSDDLLEGRAVGSKGIEMAARYHEDYFRSWDLEPAFGGSYRQAVPLRSVQTDLQASLEILGPSAGLRPVLFDDFVVNSEREDIPGEVSGELVYCGFGIQAPEREWDDFKGLDVAGKVLLVEINEPGNRPNGVFDGEDMTYYGRWPYKFEKASELGAAGVFIIHNTKGAAYGWEVVRNGWAKESFFLPDKGPRLLFQGWVSGATAEAIFAAVKLDRRALLARAETPDFAPVPLGLQTRVRQDPGHRSVDGVNVAGIIRGRHKDAAGRMVVVSAHYDHLGRNENLEGDQIFNGAVDNCSASASMLALAGYFAQRPEKLKVDLCFLAATAEEMLMLGSDYFARHMPFAADTVAANINFEMTNVWGETEDVFAIGAKHSDLDGICREAAGKIGLRYIPERNGEFGFFFRSDQVSFARAGIPAVWISQGIVSKGPDKGLVQRKFEEYRMKTYHQVTDEIQPDWDLRGTLQIIDWAREIVAVLEAREALPQFLPTSSFKRKAAGPGPGAKPPAGKER
jgi:Zn-dependent M28 family amino/carboxypeptidase